MFETNKSIQANYVFKVLGSVCVAVLLSSSSLKNSNLNLSTTERQGVGP